MSDHLTPAKTDLWFLPLGGCGEIGMNLNLYGHDDAWLMIDCGVMFDDDAVVMADPAFIAARRDKLVGIIATHAHQDHIGALSEVAAALDVPIYTTAFTAFILRRKFAEDGVSNAAVITVASGETLSIGPFRVTWLPITHSTPETHAVLLETPIASVLHTADWKVDRQPVSGAAFDQAQFASLASVDAIVCDSTNATTPGRSVSELSVHRGLSQVIENAPGRVIVSCFASNVARLQTLATITRACGRYLGVMGRSLNLMVEAGQACGYLDDDFQVSQADDLGYLPGHEVLAIVSGSQGERGAALGRLAADTHPAMNLDAGDLVIFSARTIPGNEEAVRAMIARFRERGVDVVHADDYELPLHASGHAYSDELEQMYRWTRPTIAIPVHGEPAHMTANARIAERAGVAEQLLGKNGDLFVLAGEDSPRIKPGTVPTGRLKIR